MLEIPLSISRHQVSYLEATLRRAIKAFCLSKVLLLVNIGETSIQLLKLEIVNTEFF
jgi:hypothetical protein